jgi:hypothetical protein
MFMAAVDIEKIPDNSPLLHNHVDRSVKIRLNLYLRSADLSVLLKF